MRWGSGRDMAVCLLGLAVVRVILVGVVESANLGRVGGPPLLSVLVIGIPLKNNITNKSF